MRKFPRLTTIAINIILLGITVAIWIAFAPLQVGGAAAYVVVNGDSMEPGFHSGDLAIVKPVSDYKVEDIVTYNEPDIKERVIHRIIKVEGNHFVLKGDNNDWIDHYHPIQEEIVGKLWIHVPKLGLVIQWLRLPINMALIAGMLGGVLMIGQKKQPNQHGKQNNKPTSGSTDWLEITLYILGFLTLAFLGLSIFSFTKPVTRMVENNEVYQQTGVYYYSAAMPAGIFDTETLHSGEPVFTNVTCSIIIGYSYNVTGPLQEVSGTQQLIAEVADNGSGWGRTIPLTPSTEFKGNSYSTTTTVDLCQFQDLLKSMHEKTGFQPTATLNIISKTAITAKAGGQNVYDTFDSNLVFQFGSVLYYLVNDGETDPLQTSKDGVITNPSTIANTIKFLNYELNVVGMRAIGIGGLSLVLFGLSMLGWYIFEVSKHSPEALIRIRYGPMLMEVQDRSLEKNTSVIEVSSIDDLAKLAERQNAMILHTAHDAFDYYFVQSDGVTYRYANKEEHKRQSIPVVKQEILQTIIPPSEPPPDLESTNEERSQANSLPKKITIAYDGPLSSNDQGEPELPLK